MVTYYEDPADVVDPEVDPGDRVERSDTTTTSTSNVVVGAAQNGDTALDDLKVSVVPRASLVLAALKPVLSTAGIFQTVAPMPRNNKQAERLPTMQGPVLLWGREVLRVLNISFCRS